MRIGFATHARFSSFVRKLALAIPLNLVLAVLVFGAASLILTGGVLCGLAGAWLAYGFQVVFDEPANRSVMRQERLAGGTAFRHRHA